MHRALSIELFDLHLREIASDDRYSVKRISNLEALIETRAGMYRPVFRINAVNFDLEPPLVEFAHPKTGEKLEDSQWPSGPGIANGNSLFPGHFICRPGNLAYHTHPGHLESSFENYRNSFKIKNIIDNMVNKIESNQFNMTNSGGIYLDS